MKTLFSAHPSALRFLFFGTIWERFAFYIVQGMLVLYFTQEHQFPDEQSYTLFGVFAALAFMAPLLGAYLADKIIGLKVAIITGAIFLGSGYLLLVMPWEHTDFFALAALIIGTGFYKPNVSALLGIMYEDANNKLLEKGFVLYYVAIHIGILLAGVLSGEFQKYIGWKPVFLLSCISLLIGLVTFVSCIKMTKINYRAQETLMAPKLFLTTPWIILYSAIAVPVIGYLLEADVPAEWLLSILGAALVLTFFVLAVKQQTGERKNLFILSTLILATIIFWALSLQPFFSLTLFIQELVNRNILGMQIPTTVFYAIISFFVILMSPIFARLWNYFKNCQQASSIVAGFIFCMCSLAIGFFIITLSAHFPDANSHAGSLGIIVAYFFFALAEIMFSAMGLSAITLLAPDKLISPSIVMWFLALGFGGEYAGWVAKRTDIPNDMTDQLAMLSIYHSSFLDFAYFSLSMAMVLAVVYWIARR